jgi:hypothetical protein
MQGADQLAGQDPRVLPDSAKGQERRVLRSESTPWMGSIEETCRLTDTRDSTKSLFARWHDWLSVC